MARRLAWTLTPLALTLATLALAACSLGQSNEPDLKSTVGALQNEQIALQATVNSLSNRPPASPAVATTPGAGGPSASPTPPAGAQARYVVANTEGQGVSMRAEPSTSADVVERLSEGAEVVEINRERNNDGRVWRNVRSADNKEGWVAADFLIPAQNRPAGATPAGATPSPTATPQT